MKTTNLVIRVNPIHREMKLDGLILKLIFKFVMLFISVLFFSTSYGNGDIIEMSEKQNSFGISSINDSVEKEELDIEEKFRLAISYSQLEHYEEAIELFEKIAKERNNQFAESSNWYLGLCFLKLEETDKAIKQFKKIVKEENSFSHAAKGILENLKEGM